MDVLRNLRPDLPVNDGACHVHVVPSGEQIGNVHPCELWMRIPIHLGWLDHLRLHGFKHGCHLPSSMTFRPISSSAPSPLFRLLHLVMEVGEQGHAEV